MAAEVVERNLQDALRKIWCRVQHRFHLKYIMKTKQTCVNVDQSVLVHGELTDSVLRCENGSDTESDNCDKHDQSTNVDVTSSPTDVTEISNASSTATGNKKVKRKRKLPPRLERFLKYQFDVNLGEKSSAGRELKPDTNSSLSEIPAPEQYLALDCEYLRVPFEGAITKLGRCSIVDYHGNVVYDMYSRTEEFIASHRTGYSGVISGHMTNTVPFEVVQKMVKDLLKDKILVGHDIKNDLALLKIDHPVQMIRDVQSSPFLIKEANRLGCYRNTLRSLSSFLLGRRIQTRTHCSVEDATATMDLFKLVRVEWEESLNRNKSDGHNEGVRRMLNPAAALNEVTQELGWELPKYHFECSSSEYPTMFVCKVLVNGEEYQSTSCPGKKEAKAAAAEAFFVHHRKSENDTYMDVLKHLTENAESVNQTNQSLNPVSALNDVCQKLSLELPEYHFECLISVNPPKFVCKVLVNDEEYQSTSCPSKKEAKAAAAEAFFVHHRKSENDTYMDVLKHLTENTESVNQTDQRLHPVVALNEVAQKFRWELPEYHFECLSPEYPPKFVCKVLVNDEEYESTSCSSKKEAKAAAAEAFFVHHRKSENDTYMDVLKHLTENTESVNQTDQRLNLCTVLKEVTRYLGWELPEYHYECLSSEYPPKFVCKVLVNDEEYQSTSCSSKKEAKEAAAEAFFVHNWKSENDTFINVLNHLTENTESEN